MKTKTVPHTFADNRSREIAENIIAEIGPARLPIAWCADLVWLTRLNVLGANPWEILSEADPTMTRCLRVDAEFTFRFVGRVVDRFRGRLPGVKKGSVEFIADLLMHPSIADKMEEYRHPLFSVGSGKPVAAQKKNAPCHQPRPVADEADRREILALYLGGIPSLRTVQRAWEIVRRADSKSGSK